jgi:hypothetical protein
MILAIDPGNIESAYALLDENLKPVEFGKFVNQNVKSEVRRLFNKHFPNVHIVIEMVASYGMSVGKEVFETCVWIGRFYELFGDGYTSFIYRKDVKMNLCHSMKANDSNIRQALIDRFGPVGTKKEKGWFYGVSKDIWSAIAVGVTYHDMREVNHET